MATSNDSLPRTPLNHIYEHRQVSARHEFNRVGRFCVHSVTDPVLARAVLQSRDMVLPSFVKKGLSQLIGDEALIVIEGKDHKKSYAALHSMFTPGGVGENIAPTILHDLDTEIDRWSDGRPFDMGMDMRHLTGGTITQAMFGDNITTQQARDIVEAATVEVNVAEPIPLSILAGRVFGRHDWGKPNKPSRELRDGIDMVNGIFDGIIQGRRGMTNQPADILGRFLEENDPPLTDTQIKYQMMMIVFAGHDTTSETATFGFRELIKHPDELEHLRRHVHDIAPDGIITPAHLRKMTEVHKVIHETLRLYAPAHRLAREATEDVVLNGFGFKKGDIVRIGVQDMQRDPGIWGEDANEFRSSRFDDPARLKDLLAFGVGLHQCLGRAMATQVLTAIFAKTCSRLELEIVQDIRGTKLGFTQRADGDLITRAAPLRMAA